MNTNPPTYQVVGAPVCECPAGATGEGWDADGDIDADTLDDSDGSADAESEAENARDIEVSYDSNVL